MARELRPVYTAPSEAAANERWGEFAGKWGARYPAIVRLWDNAWFEFVPDPWGLKELSRVSPLRRK